MIIRRIRRMIMIIRRIRRIMIIRIIRRMIMIIRIMRIIMIIMIIIVIIITGVQNLPACANGGSGKYFKIYWHLGKFFEKYFSLLGKILHFLNKCLR
jgi:hypothetical protein